MKQKICPRAMCGACLSPFYEIVTLSGSEAFNRAMLMNVGYVEALKERPFDCFIFHDVDLLPEDDRNLYTCPEQPRHMSVAVDKFKYRYSIASREGTASLVTFRDRSAQAAVRRPVRRSVGDVP